MTGGRQSRWQDTTDKQIKQRSGLDRQQTEQMAGLDRRQTEQMAGHNRQADKAEVTT